MIWCDFKNNKNKIKNAFFLFFVILILTGLLYLLEIMNYTVTKSVYLKSIHNHNISIPQSIDDIIINVYNTEGKIYLRIISSVAKYYENSRVIQFLNPSILVLNKENIVIWQITCDKGLLKNNTTLFLNGCVCINRILNGKYFQSILTNQALINLIDQYVTTNTVTIIHGCCFYSIGSKMYFSFKTKKIKLFGNIYTQYEVKHI